MSEDYGFLFVFDLKSDLYAVMVSWYSCDRIADESSTFEDIDTEEFVESMTNRNSKRKTFSDHKILMS